MALFEGEDIISVDVVSTNLVDDIPNLIGDAVMTAITLDQSIAHHVTLANVGGLTSMAKSYLRNGKSNYIYGLPDGSISAGQIDKDALVAAINDDMNITTASLGVEEPIVSNPLAMYLAYHLTEVYTGWTVKTNSVKRDSGYYIGNYSMKSYEFVSYEDNAYLEVTLESDYPEPDWVLLFGYYAGAQYYNVVYYVNSDPDDKRYWTYASRINEYPDLEFGKEKYGENYLPIVPLRINRRNLNDENPVKGEYNEEEHKSCERQLKSTSIEMDELIAGINENESIDDIQAAFFLYAVPLYSDKPATLLYLFEYIKDLELKSGVNQEAYIQWFDSINANAPVSDPPVNMHRIIELNGYFNMSIEWNFINKSDTIDPAYTGEITTSWVDGNSPDRYPYEMYDPLPGEVIRTGWVVAENGQFIITGPLYDNEGVLVGYSTYLIHGLVIRTEIQAFNESTLTITRVAPWDTEPPVDELDPKTGMVIPVNHNLLKSLQGVKDDELLYDSLQVVIYSGIKTSLKWYETADFLNFVKFIMTFVSVIFAALGLAAMVKAGLTMLQIGLRLAGQVLVGLAASYLLAEVDGPLGIILAAVVSYYGTQFFGSAGMDFSKLALPSANDLLKIVKTVATSFVESTQNQLINLQEEYSDWLDEARGQMDALEAAEELLAGPNSLLDYATLNYGYSTQRPGESPGDFIHRTTHIMNPGVLSLDAISSYVDRSLALPEPILT